ncbi:integrase core domain-containing protein [Synechococcus sp. GFB01]|nr:integrase core domain-containing protein [Synechococcus sp. GFB01]
MRDTLLEEWIHVMPYGSSAARNALLLAYLRIYNGRRCHMALGGLTP